MKHLLLLLTCVCLVALTTAPAAADPVAGTYYSTDLGGSLLIGRYTNSRTSAALSGGVGDVFLAQSWDGTTLGTQWDLRCAYAPSAYVTVDHRTGGVGGVDYTRTYTGGTFFFAAGPWGSGTGVLGTSQVQTTVQYINIGGVSTPMSFRDNIHTTGTFAGGVCALTFFQSNGYNGGDTAWPSTPSKPAGYPVFLDASCGSGGLYGSWGNINKVTFMIQCSTPTKPSTWGAVRKLYR
jgi:hypothetical protein